MEQIKMCIQSENLRGGVITVYKKYCHLSIYLFVIPIFFTFISDMKNAVIGNNKQKANLIVLGAVPRYSTRLLADFLCALVKYACKEAAVIMLLFS